MKTLFHALFICLNGILIVQAQAQGVNSLSYIPNDAQNIYVLNTPSIIKKADIQALKQLDFIKDALFKTESESNEINTLMKNPAESGLNFLKPIVIASQPSENFKYDWVSVIAPLADFNKFEKMMQTFQRKVENSNDIHISKGDSNSIAWNKEIVIFTTLSKKKQKGLAALGADADSTSAPLPQLDPSVLFNKKVQSAKVDAVAALMREQHDIYLYKTTDGTSKSPSAMIAGMLFNLNPDDLDGNVTNGWADFENGRIIGKSHQNLNKAMKDKFGTLINKKPSVNWNNYINTATDSKPILTLSLSLNPSGIRQMIEESPLMKQGIEKAKTKSKNKLNIDDIFKMVSGDVFMSLANGVDNKPVFLGGLSLKDKTGFMELIRSDSSVTELGNGLFASKKKKQTDDSAPPTEGGLPFPKNEEIFFLFKDDVMLLGSETHLKSLQNAALKPASLASEWQKNLANKPFNIYMDFQSLTRLDNKASTAATNRLEGIPIESFSINVGEGISLFELNMIDKNKNALFSFAEMVDTFIKKQKEKDRLMKEQMEQNMKAVEEEEAPRKRDSTLRN